MRKIDIYSEYEALLLSPTIEQLSGYIFRKSENGVFSDSIKKKNQKTAIIIIKYAIENILYLTPDEAKKYLNNNVLKHLKLEKIIKNYIKVPKSYRKNRIEYIINLCYPEYANKNKKKNIKKLFMNVENNHDTYLPSLFSEEDGIFIANELLRLLIDKYLSAQMDIYDLYDFFSSDEGYDFIKKHKLYDAMKIFYDSPLSYFHFSLKEENQVEILYLRNHYIMQKKDKLLKFSDIIK